MRLLALNCDATSSTRHDGRYCIADVPAQFQAANANNVTNGISMTELTNWVVSREGSLITQAFLASLAGGIGRGFSANANALFQGTNVSVNGSRPQLSPEELLKAGLGEGVSGAADVVSKYLIERAEQYQPVIEMPTGVDVEIVFLDGAFVRN